MSVDDLRSLVTVLAFLAFVGVVAWACTGTRRREFETAARLPFADAGGLEGDAGEPRR